MKGGSWTAFVPTDSAFEVFFKENGYQSVADMPQSRIESFIKFSLVTDAYNTTTLTYARIAWYAGNSFRRRTQYSDSTMLVDSKDYPFVGEYPNTDDYVEKTYIVDESRGRTKTINYWLDDYVTSAKKAIEPGDYAYMFPGEDEYEVGAEDMRVYGSNVEKANIITENGIVYSLDEVLEPQPNYYQYLTSNPDKYSTFKRLIDRFSYFRFSSLEENEETGAIDSVYQIRFKSGVANNFLAFEPNDENMPYLMASMDFTETHATSILAPNDAAYAAFLNEENIITDYYSSYDDMPLNVLGKMLSMNFFTNTWDICPSHLGQSYSTGYDFVDFSESEIVDRKFCSNGFLVGSNKVRVASSFETVLGPLLLDADYSIMLSAVQSLGIETALEGTGIKYSILGLRNDQFIDIPDPNSATRTVSVVGYKENLSIIYLKVEGDPDPTANRVYPDSTAASPSGTDIDYVTATLESIIENQLVFESFGDKDNYYQTQSGEYIFVNADQSEVSGGTELSTATPVNVETTRDAVNGKFYTLDKYVSRPQYNAVGALTTSPYFISDYFQFFMCLQMSDVLLPVAGTSDFLITLLNATKQYTLLIPTNEAVLQAITDGAIPNPFLVPSMGDLDKATAIIQLKDFIKKHFVQHSIPTNGATEGTYKSLYDIGEANFALIYQEYNFTNYYDTQELVIKDPETGAVLANTTEKVNTLSKGVIIQQIDTYLK